MQIANNLSLGPVYIGLAVACLCLSVVYAAMAIRKRKQQ